MKRIISIFAAMLAIVSMSAQSVKTVVIPQPMEATAAKGSYTLSAKSVVVAKDASLVRPAELFAEYVAKDLGATIAVEGVSFERISTSVTLMRLSSRSHGTISAKRS